MTEMARMPDIEAELGSIEHAAERFGHAVTGLFRHHAETAPQTPATAPETLATAPAAAATQQGDHMSLTQIEADVKADLTDGTDWLLGFATRLKNAAPSIIATSEAVGGSTVGKLVEAAAGSVLPPQFEQIAVDFIKDLVTKYGQPVTAAPVATAPPQQ